MRFKGLDLNLLQALDVLLEERHVSRAAERMNITQPAMSGALMRLRQYFDDPLLTPHGNRMILTPHAVSLIPKLKRLIGDIDAFVAQLSRFDPATSERTFIVTASDYVVAIIFPRVSEFITKVAPNVSLEFRNPSEQTTEMFEQGSIDLHITPEYMMQTEHIVEHLYDEEQVALGWSKNPSLAADRLTEEQFYSCGHVVVELGRIKRDSYVERLFARMETKRKIFLKVSSFLSVPELLIGTSNITVTHKSLAQKFAERLDLKVCRLPFDFPPMRQMISCHQARINDPGVQWLKTLIERSVGEISI